MTKLLLLLLIVSLPIRADRGINVSYMTSEASSATVAGQMRLYSSSHALVIGIDDYTNGWPRLSQAILDAHKVAKALENKGFDVTLLTDLNGKDLEVAFEDFFIDKGRDPNSRLFVWYAGHGHTLDGEGYLIPADGVMPKDEGNFLRRSLSLREFSRFVRLAKSKHVYTVFDSCFAGTIFNVARSAPPPAITRITSEPVRQFLSSGGAGQTVSDDGTFAKLFVESLEGTRRADLNGDGYLTADELGGFLTDKISNYTNNKQVPRHGKLRDPNYDRGDFVFLTSALIANTLPPRDVRPVQSSIVNDRTSIEREFWSAVNETNNLTDLEDYLSAYPDGLFTKLAKLKIRRLRNKLPWSPEDFRAKGHLAVQENFVNNQNNWILEKTKKYKLAIEKGVYILSSKKQTTKAFWPSFDWSHQGEYMVEVQVRFLQGRDDMGYGFAWDDILPVERVFMIAKKGYYMIRSEATGTWYARTLAPDGSDKLMLIRRESSMDFYLNGQHIKSLPHNIPSSGFALFADHADIAFESITIYER